MLHRCRSWVRALPCVVKRECATSCAARGAPSPRPPRGVEVRAGRQRGVRRWLRTMWICGVLRQVSRSGQERASQPVSRHQRMQRLTDAEHPDETRERLKNIARRVDTWSEKRSNKTIYESWMGMYNCLIKAIAPRTRIVIGLVALGFSFAGLYVADWLEDTYPERNHRSGGAPSQPQLQGPTTSDESKPRFFSISVVDRT